jgi:hypothetical protein
MGFQAIQIKSDCKERSTVPILSCQSGSEEEMLWLLVACHMILDCPYQLPALKDFKTPVDVDSESDPCENPITLTIVLSQSRYNQIVGSSQSF